MNYKNIKVISSDIDGTIVDSSHEIHEVTSKKINELRKRGYIFGLASGRPAIDISNKYLEWGIDSQFDFLIGLNGVELYDVSSNKVISYNLLKKEWIKEIIEEMSVFNATVHMYCGNEYYSSLETERAWYSAFKNKRKFVVVPIEKFYENDSGGLMFRCDLNRMPEIEKRLSIINSENRGYVGFKTQKDLVEFSNSDANKGYALKKYCEIHNIDLDDVMAIGDTTNDNEMLKVCHGVCMKNGSDDTKALAEIITDKTDSEDGFVDFVDKYLLNSK